MVDDAESPVFSCWTDENAIRSCGERRSELEGCVPHAADLHYIAPDEHVWLGRKADGSEVTREIVVAAVNALPDLAVN